MKAKALITSAHQKFSLESVELPDPQDNEVLVKTAYSGVSVGTEFALIRNKINWGPYPLITGYMSTGEVESVGSTVTEVKPGDKVFLRMSKARAKRSDGSECSPVAGLHCSHAISEVGGTHGLWKLPENCDLETSSMFVMPAVGYKSVDTSAPQMGETVAVLGCGLIGLGVIAAASMRGCRVIAIDVDPAQLSLAKRFGADITIDSKQQSMSEVIKSYCPDGADLVYESTGIPALIQPAIELCRVDGKFIWQGNYGDAPLDFSFIPAHTRRLQMFFPCDDGYLPSRLTVLKHMASGILPWQDTVTHRISAEEAPEVYRSILDGDTSYKGTILNWN